MCLRRDLSAVVDPTLEVAFTLTGQGLSYTFHTPDVYFCGVARYMVWCFLMPGNTYLCVSKAVDLDAVKFQASLLTVSHDE